MSYLVFYLFAIHAWAIPQTVIIYPHHMLHSPAEFQHYLIASASDFDELSLANISRFTQPILPPQLLGLSPYKWGTVQSLLAYDILLLAGTQAFGNGSVSIPGKRTIHFSGPQEY